MTATEPSRRRGKAVDDTALAEVVDVIPAARTLYVRALARVSGGKDSPATLQSLFYSFTDRFYVVLNAGVASALLRGTYFSSVSTFRSVVCGKRASL